MLYQNVNTLSESIMKNKLQNDAKLRNGAAN